MYLLSGNVTRSARFFQADRASARAGWSVLPLACLSHGETNAWHARQHGGVAALIDEDGASLPPTEHLRFVAEVVAPAATESTTAEVASTPADAGNDSAPEVDSDLNIAVPDGDLVAIGALACLLSAVGTVAALAWLVSELV